MLQRTTLRRLIVPVVLCAAACVAVRAPGQETDTAATVEAAVEDMDEAATVSEVFDIARELDRLGASGLTAVKEALPEAGPRARLGLARYLLGQRERKMALASLEETIRGEDVEAAASAAEMIERYAEDKKEVLRLKSILEQVREPSVKIAVAKALRARANDTKAEAVLKDYLKSGEFEVRANAALALAEIGNVAAAKSVLNELADEPTDRGKRAKSLLYQDKLVESLRRSGGLSGDKHTKRLEAKVDALKEELEKTQKKAEAAAAAAAKGGGGKAKAPAAKGYKLLEELTKNIKEYYVEEDERTEDKQLFDEAAKGMVGSLDPFSSYMTEKETQDFRQSMSGSYAGIGAVVSIDPKDKLLTIIRPIYSGPAYKAGLRSLDKITKVEGESTFGKKVEQLVTKLKGKPDTPVKISVFRKGWKKEREFTLMRGTITLKSVHHKMLPGKIGYISLSQFGDKAVDEIEDAMTELEQQGMRAMIFDLRNNPGGLLTAAVDISDKFLKDNKLIVYSQGRNKRIAPRRDYRTRQTSTHPDIPLVVLINGASA
ncbi:MAG: S41 family peptidase, partial [Planctomycetota bacterium]